MELYEKAGGFYNAGPFTPFLYHDEGTPPHSTIIFPGNGGPNWGGMAADPRSGYVYVQTHDAALSGWIEKSGRVVTMAAAMDPPNLTIEAA